MYYMHTYIPYLVVKVPSYPNKQNLENSIQEEQSL